METLDLQIKKIFNSESRAGWEAVKFSDVAHEVKETTNDPLAEGIERVVGLENLETLDLHIRSWGEKPDATTFTRKFRKGHVLFGRRRAYQRKAALADFDGICSGDIIVLEANENKMEPGLLPFLVHSDEFFNWAVSTSAGSLSPRTKFKHLAEFRFHLPPRPVQQKLVELLSATDISEEKYRVALTNLSLTSKALFHELTQIQTDQKNLGECLKLSKAKSTYPHKLDKYLGLEHIEPGAFSTETYIDAKLAKSTCNVFKSGQLLYSKLRPNLDKAIIATFDGVCTTELLVYDAMPGINLEYMLHYLHSDAFIHYAVSRGFGTKMPRISHKIVSEFKVYAPDIKEQEKILENLSQLTSIGAHLSNSIQQTRTMRSAILHQVL